MPFNSIETKNTSNDQKIHHQNLHRGVRCHLRNPSNLLHRAPDALLQRGLRMNLWGFPEMEMSPKWMVETWDFYGNFTEITLR